MLISQDVVSSTIGAFLLFKIIDSSDLRQRRVCVEGDPWALQAQQSRNQPSAEMKLLRALTKSYTNGRLCVTPKKRELSSTTE